MDSYNPLIASASHILFGDPLCLFYHNWQSITFDRWILQIFIKSYAIHLKLILFSNSTQLFPFQGSMSWESEVLSCVRAGAIEEVPHKYRRKVFKMILIPKRDGGLHSILILRKLNSFIRKFQFHMLSVASIIPSLSFGTGLQLSFREFCTTIFLKIPTFYSEEESLSIQGPPFWVFCHSKVLAQCLSIVRR